MEAFMGPLAHQAGDNWITRAGEASTYFRQMSSDFAMVPLPEVGRRFGATRRVRLGDASPGGRLRLDAMARYLQDVANDDAHDSGIANPGGWVVRRTTIDVRTEVAFRELVEVTTFCSAIGKRWAERRTVIAGDAGGRVEAASLWVQVDMASGRPTSLAEDFRAVYGPSAAGRTVSASLHHGEPPSNGDRLVFPLRFSDFDVMGHVNNAVYWAVVEEALRGRWSRRGPWRAEVEHRRPIESGGEVAVLVARLDHGPDAADGDDGSVGVWMSDAQGLAATGLVRDLPPT
jgi:acyl-ACP thioesterase